MDNNYKRFEIDQCIIWLKVQWNHHLWGIKFCPYRGMALSQVLNECIWDSAKWPLYRGVLTSGSIITQQTLIVTKKKEFILFSSRAVFIRRFAAGEVCWCCY